MKKILETLKTSHPVELIDKFGIDGDFIESQAFAYLAVRSYLKLPISFPDTTGCSIFESSSQIRVSVESSTKDDFTIIGIF